MASRTPTLQEVLNRLVDRALVEMRAGLPGRVESYDSATQLASVKPLIKDQFENEEGDIENVGLPVITNVPVIFPGGGGFRITFPIAAGDTVWLSFADRSMDAWQDQGGETAPADRRRHHLSDAVCFPGLHPNNAAWTGAEAGVITIGLDGGAANFVARADLVDAALSALATGVNACKTALALTPPTSVSGVGSATVKVKG